MNKRRVLPDFLRSVRDAWHGLLLVFRTEQSFRLQIAGALIAFICLVVFPLSTWERVAVILCVTLVLVLELLNSMVERLSDLLRPRMHDTVRDVKDVMAGAVLLSAFMCLFVTCLIFAPHIALLLELV